MLKLKKIGSSVSSSVSSVKDSLRKNLKGLTMCKKCYAFYYQRDWHFEAPSYVRDETEKEISVRLTSCPSCIELETAIEERDSNDLVSYGFMPS